MTADQLKQFHNELKSVLAAGVSLGKPKLTKAKLDRFEATILKGLDPNANQPITKALETPDLSHGLPSQYLAALKTFEHTGSISPVLDGLAEYSVVENQLARVVRGALVYLAIILAITAAGLCCFVWYVSPVLYGLREDPSAKAANRVTDLFDTSPLLLGVAVVIGIVLLAILFGMMAGQLGKIALWFGGKQYMRFKIASRALRVLQTLLDSNMPVAEAVATSCQLTNADPAAIADVESATINSDNLQVTKIASYFSLLAGRRLDYLKISIPSVLLFGVGGVATAIYCLAVFSPIISLLEEVIKANEVFN